MGDLSPSELLDLYWQASHVPEEDVEKLQVLAGQILAEGAGAAEGEETLEEKEE